MVLEQNQAKYTVICVVANSLSGQPTFQFIREYLP